MKSKQSQTKIDISEKYDQEDDIYYVTFKTGEPSYVVEVDDVLLIEMGIFSQTPTGFRILNFTKNKVGGVKFLVREIGKAFESAKDSFTSTSRIRESQIEQALEKVLA